MQVTSRWLRTSGASFRAAQARRGVADLRSYNAEFCEWGSGPPLIIVPGLAGGIDLIEPLARRLADRFHVIAYQHRGENDCFALRRRFGLLDLSDDLAEFIDWRGLERPMVLGASFGGVIALNLAARRPDLVSALGLQGVGMSFESGLVQRIAGMVLSSYPLPEDSTFINQFFNLLFGQKPSPVLFEHVIRTCWQTDQSVMTHRLRLLRRFSFEDMLPRVTMPTLLVGGTKDVLVSKSNAKALVDGLPNGRCMLFEKAGHLVPVSHVSQAAEAFGDFFASAEG